MAHTVVVAVAMECDVVARLRWPGSGWMVRAQGFLPMGPVEALEAGVLVGFIPASQRVPDGDGYSVR